MKRIFKISVLVVGIGMIVFFASMNPGLMPANGVSTVAASEEETAGGVERVTLKVDGMTCRSCVKPLQKALLKVPGVKNARVSYSAAQAVVECEKGKVTNAQLVKAIEDQSSFFLTFTAKVTSRD